MDDLFGVQGVNIVGVAEPLTPDEAMLASVIRGYEGGDFGVSGDEIVGAAAPIARRVAVSAAVRRPAAVLTQRYNAAAQRAASTAMMRAQQGSALAQQQQMMLAAQQQQAMARAMGTPTPFSPGGTSAIQTGLGPIREVVQGLDSGPVLIAAGAAFPITVNVTMAFRPTRLMVGPAVAPSWVIDNIRVGPDSLFLGSPGSVPAENFLPDAVTAAALKRKTAQGGTPVIVDVTNIDGVPRRFRGSLFGEAADAAQC